ncbi:PilZ domain-containing protein [Vibrio paucivorans]
MPSTHQSIDELYTLLTPGLKLSVVIEFGPNDQFTFATHLIGFKHGAFIILDVPMKVRSSLVMRTIDNVSIVVRGISNSKLGHIIAFKTTILTSTTKPANLMFLRPPQRFASKPTRAHERYSLDLETTITEGTKTYQAYLRDISLTGCALFILGENELTKSSVIEIENDLTTFFSNEIKYQIVNITKTKSGHKIGIKFNHSIEMTDELKGRILELSVNASVL